MPGSLSRTLAWFAAGLRADRLPPNVDDKIKALLLQNVVSGLAGYEHSKARRMIDLVKREESRPDGGCRILVDGSRVTKAGAAFANSELVHRGGRLDIYRVLTHPGTTIVPAALVAGEAAGASGADLLAALAAGYECQARIARDWIPATQARGFRSSPVFGIFGATIAAGKLLGLDEGQLNEAIGISVEMAAGNLEGARTGSDAVSIHEPAATRNAILAVLLAADGVRGGDTSLEGPAGFYHAYGGSGTGRLSHSFDGARSVDPGAAVEGLGERWEVLQTAHRIYAVAGYNLALIDVGAALADDLDLAAEDIERVEVVMHWVEVHYPSPVFPRPPPGIRVGGPEYYTAWGLAERGYPMRRGRPDGRKGTPDEPGAVLDLMHRIRIRPSRTRSPFAPRIEVWTRDGRRHVRTATGREFLFDLAEQERRIEELADGLPVPRATYDRLVASVRDLEQLDRVADLVDLTIARIPAPVAGTAAGF